MDEALKAAYPAWAFSALGPSWLKRIGPEIHKPYFGRMLELLKEEKKTYPVFPPSKDVFAAFRTQPEDIKVVILGQDPYHTPGVANGLAFSCHDGLFTSPPPSLANIFREIERDLHIVDLSPSTDLTRWAQQGVFLLNASLTVRQGLPGSHSQIGWKTFTRAVIASLNKGDLPPSVYMLWGTHAREYDELIKAPNHVLRAAHPSPLSAHRGFFGCRHFSAANRFLHLNGRQPIRWQSTSTIENHHD